MTNHDEASGRPGIGDMGGPSHHGGEPGGYGEQGPAAPPDEPQITLRTPAELADALPYLLGYRPEDSIVLVALHDREGRGRFGGRARLGIPAHPDDWQPAARQVAHGLVTGSERRGARPESMVVYLVREPSRGETGRDVMERLRPLAQSLRTTCGALDIPVVEALCISDGRFWSYCCPGPDCCPPEGRPMGLPGTSVLAAAAAYAGVQVRGSIKEFRARLSPWETAAALGQEIALDAASRELVPRILDGDTREDVAAHTLALAQRVMARFAGAPPVPGTTADLRDDTLLADDEAAALILGLQDRTTRDRAAEWMEGTEAVVALRLWRALARRCVGPYGEHAAAPLTLAGWVAWSTGDGVEAREAFAMALGADPDYLFARLLHQACNEGLDPETVRRCLRTERAGRTGPDADPTATATAPGVDTTVTAAAPGADTTVTAAAPGEEPTMTVATPGEDAAVTRTTADGDTGSVPDLPGSSPDASREHTGSGDHCALGHVPVGKRRKVRAPSGISRRSPRLPEARRRSHGGPSTGDRTHRDGQPRTPGGRDGRFGSRRASGSANGEGAT
ncbi:DUF4192 family protein [Streptomyces sp. NPDC052040]|uniref:DUF4192 domain-containing protein n=1 Tax=Streptomyces sp. NPDC052040 TaxID=3365682 RepID=UPI0037D92A84